MKIVDKIYGISNISAKLAVERANKCEECGLNLDPWDIDDKLIDSRAIVVHFREIGGTRYRYTAIYGIRGVAHHVNGNHSNNDPSNLRYLCASCHTKLHQGIRRLREIREGKRKETTISIPMNVHEDLILLKMELKRDTYAEVISDLIKLYRETYGWSSLALADGLRKLKDAVNNRPTFQDIR